MAVICLGSSQLTLGLDLITLGGVIVEGATVSIGGRWRAVVELAQFAPDKPIGLWRGDRQVIGRFRGNSQSATWRAATILATWGKS